MYPSTGVPASNLRPTSRTLPYLRVILGGLRTVIRPWASRAGIRYRRRYRRQICNWLTRILKAGRWVVGRWRNIDRNRIGICDGLRIRSGQENGGPGKNPKSKDQSIVTIAMSDHGDRHHRLPAIIAGRKLSYMLSAIKWRSARSAHAGVPATAPVVNTTATKEVVSLDMFLSPLNVRATQIVDSIE